VSRAYSIDRVLQDSRLLGAALGDSASWAIWRVVLKASFGIQLTPCEMETFRSVAGDRAPPRRRARELWAVVGRRGGKSRIAAAIAVYLALFVKHKLARGERGMVLVLSASVEQAKTVFSYAEAFLSSSAVLAKEIQDSTRGEIRLKNGIIIAMHASSFRTVRGRTLLACVLDEVAYFRDETSAVPDIETYRAVLPALATTSGMLIGISTPYRRLGLLYQKHRDFFGKDSDDVLVVQGGTKLFNASISDDVIDAQRRDDPTAAASEWDATFRTDISSFLDDQLIDAAVEYSRPVELPPIRNTYTYYKAFCDASGGTGHDSYTIAIGHKEGELFHIDALRGTIAGHRFDPQEVTKQYAALLTEYGVSSVTGDAYAAEWVAGAWRSTGITYIRSDAAKSQIYLECIPLFTRGLVRLPDHSKLLRELRLLERQAHRGGKESVDHPRGGHDDFANAVCGALHGLSLRLGYDQHYRAFDPDYVAPSAAEQLQPSADQRLRDLYLGIDSAIRWGMAR
jgi:hypothetical protein